MDALALDPAGYGGTYKLIGGRLSLDFINTISWRDTERHHDWLSSAENVRRWADAAGLIADDVFSPDLDRIREIRSVLTDLLRPLTRDEDPHEVAVQRFNAELTTAASRRILDPHDLEWTWIDQAPHQTLLDPVVLDAAAVATTLDRTRLRHCPGCDWAFYDQTRNGRRRWCDMADCGSRDKSRRYYERNK